MKINQRDIVEVNFELPNGDFKTHPALVISNQQVLEAEDIFYAVMISTKERKKNKVSNYAAIS